MKNPDEILRYFPNSLYENLSNIFKQNPIIWDRLQEIRIRVGRQIILKLRDQDILLEYVVSQSEILQMLERLCENSIYAYKNQICEGFITVKGGHRVGIAGSCVIENGKIINVKYISSLNFRIAREIINCSTNILREVIDKENEIPNYHGFPVFCGESAIEDFAQLNWVDEALFSIPTELPLPDKMIKNFGIMGITVHIKLARVADDSSNQIVEKLEGYTVLSISINMVSTGQLIFKRTMDICGGLVGMLLTGIIFIFVAPIIYIKSPGPIFFKQVRIGKNGKKFNIYKFRSMYMDAEERKKELMAQNDIKDGMMFKMDNDPRIIKGIGNFIRDYSLDEFPQFWNVLIGDMSLVGVRDIIGTTRENSSIYAACVA